MLPVPRLLQISSVICVIKPFDLGRLRHPKSAQQLLDPLTLFRGLILDDLDERNSFQTDLMTQHRSKVRRSTLDALHGCCTGIGVAKDADVYAGRPKVGRDLYARDGCEADARILQLAQCIAQNIASQVFDPVRAWVVFRHRALDPGDFFDLESFYDVAFFHVVISSDHDSAFITSGHFTNVFSESSE